MKRLAVVAMAALASPAYAAPPSADIGRTFCVWGKPAVLLSRLDSGRAGYEALLVRRPNEAAPFFIQMRRGLPLSAACRI
jgi:hypothetical protein